MAVNKVVYVENGVQKTLIDLTADTVTAETLKKGFDCSRQNWHSDYGDDGEF